MDKTCWSCGHWIIGFGCYVNGEVEETDHDHSCSSWVKEGTEGTVTDYTDGSEERR